MADAIEIVAACRNPEAVREYFGKIPRVSAMSGDDESRVGAIWDSKIKVELKLVEDREYPCMFTTKT